MDKTLNPEDNDKFSMIVFIDHEKLKTKTDKFRLTVDTKKVKTYADLKIFYDNYKDYLSKLSIHQIDLMLIENNWSQSLVFAKAVNKFKNIEKNEN